jgi:signal transduction histidine kinase
VRIPIRLKLAGALAVPLLALAGVVAYEVDQADARAEEVAIEVAMTRAAMGPGSLITTLQNERNFSGVELLGLVDQLALPVSSYDEALGEVDEARANLDRFLAEQGPDVSGVFAAGLSEIDRELEALRDDVATSDRPRDLTNAPFVNDVFSRYSAIIQTFIDVTTDLAFRVEDADLRTGVELIRLATLNAETGAQIVRSILLGVLTGDTGEATRQEVAALILRLEDIHAAALVRSVGPYAGAPEAALLNDETALSKSHYVAFARTGTTDVAALAAAVGATAGDDFTLSGLVADDLEQQAASILEDAEDQRRTVVVLAVVLVVTALAVTVVASRSITNPLRSLTTQAHEMASTRLPAAVQQVLDTTLGHDVVVPEVPPISVRSRDEVVEVVEALNTVQTSALDLAVEQAALRRNIADSFVNLGRRNQNLLDRQLEAITELEREEPEPERLETLFRLDHLATRMRRNAESLLRLAGADESGPGGWTEPVPVADVVRSALSEIEDFQRVDLRRVEPALLHPAAGADLAHLLAELVENALHFSPPDEQVDVRGRATPTGYTLAVADCGVGMTAEQLETANRRLAGAESFTVAPSRYIGHYVAGRLAATLGARVTLEPQAAGGITARIDLPATMVLERSGADGLHDPPATSDPGVEFEGEPPTTPPWSAPTTVVDEPPDDPAPVPAPAAAGLTRRVRGASAPVATSVAAAFGGGDQPAQPGTGTDLSSLLAAYHDGVRRGLRAPEGDER